MNINILLIEDNPGDARLFQEMIKEANLEIDEKLVLFHKTSIDNSINDFIQENNISIIFLDLGLPGSQGEETVIKFNKINNSLPIIAYTGTNDISLGARLLHLGVGDYICKFDATPSIIIKSIWLTIERSKLKNTLHEKENMLLLQSRSAAMGDMIGMIAHQWRQPLSVLSMAMNNIQVDYDLNGKIEEADLLNCISDSSEQIKYLSSTIDDFKSFFSPEKEKKPYTIKQAIEDTLKLINKSLENSGIEVIKQFENIEPFEFYPNELLQVLVNILKNAKEALVANNIENKKITIRIYQKEKYAYIEIEDNGGGIPKDVLPRVFEPYFTTKGVSSGTGIGLYMSQTIIKDHFCGKITAMNFNDGVRFTCKILITN